MYRSKKFGLSITIALLALSLLVAACGPSANVPAGNAGSAGNTGAAARLNKQGNEAFAEGTFDQALVSYQEAQDKAPELAEPYYNGSNALYRQEAYPEASEQMKRALNQAQSESLAQSGHYNLGNASYQSEDWEAAVQAYKQALLLNPEDHDAKYNLELALQQLQQQQQEQQEQEQEQEQNEGDGEQDPQDQQDQQDQNQEGDPQDEQDEQDQGAEDSEDPQDQQDEQDQDQNQDQQRGGGQPENEGDEQGNPQPQPGQRMTSEQARQLLAAIAQDAETLQERLGQIFRAPNPPSAQDW